MKGQLTRRVLIGTGAFMSVIPARAADDLPARLRLVGGEADSGGAYLAGAELVLRPGWLTYWRYPGPLGIPPRFDWTGSQNVVRVSVDYPVPGRFSEGDIPVAGYRDNVVFILHVVPVDLRVPVHLALTLEYGLCEQVCIPARSQAHAVLGQASPPLADIQRLEQARARIPRRVPPEEVLQDWTYHPVSGHLVFMGRLVGGIDQAIIEAPSEFTCPLPSLQSSGDGHFRAEVTLPHPPDDLTRHALMRVTLAGPANAVEFEHALDG